MAKFPRKQKKNKDKLLYSWKIHRNRTTRAEVFPCKKKLQWNFFNPIKARLTNFHFSFSIKLNLISIDFYYIVLHCWVPFLRQRSAVSWMLVELLASPPPNVGCRVTRELHKVMSSEKRSFIEADVCEDWIKTVSTSLHPFEWKLTSDEGMKANFTRKFNLCSNIFSIFSAHSVCEDWKLRDLLRGKTLKKLTFFLISFFITKPVWGLKKLASNEKNWHTNKYSMNKVRYFLKLLR